MSGEYYSTKDSHSRKFEERLWIFIKLNFRELCNSKLSGNMVIIHWVENRSNIER